MITQHEDGFSWLDPTELVRVLNAIGVPWRFGYSQGHNNIVPPAVAFKAWTEDEENRLVQAIIANGAEVTKVLVRSDFTTFRAAECQAKSPVKTLDRFAAERAGEEICVFASARSFLHHQVRSMVGSLVLVGEGKWSAKNLAAALAARSRSACGPVAPPEGLYLSSVEY